MSATTSVFVLNDRTTPLFGEYKEGWSSRTDQAVLNGPEAMGPAASQGHSIAYLITINGR